MNRDWTLIETLLPQDTNSAGNIFGGVLMSLMDKAAAITAWRYARCDMVTAGAEEIAFIRPVHVGEVVKVEARVVCTGRTSIDMAVMVEAEDVFTGQSYEAARGYFTMVALDKGGKPTEVPPWEPRTEEERRRCEASGERRARRRERK
ncbi:thioesterase superfamily protein [Geobacter metallireducens RCH3]|uniref:Long-chain acyl-CoA thioesterase, BFIT_BACH family n=1 Tax=Geobacter metallireducens (strain ATCC 53774 / DSM 7210 / GS-15) TaxID=269799 RepID=Q39XL3_GEOMG|nr:acyl-CoA thioesterase [Geobacter metallireducens]ABB31011.1 long-chain acyl-CoA thioesterase, BFIT_BACH family [Geobacter metallireducens GS-15]EHP86017.1 thioesterase superfamily protein [Geobacter metallireducens RCH3]